MQSIFKYIKKIGFKRKTSLHRSKVFLGELKQKKNIKKTYKKRKNIHFQTHLNLSGQKKILFYSYISIGALLLVGILLITLSTKFTVKNIEIVRQDNISNINLAYNAVDRFRGKSIFTVDKAQIIDSIYSYQNNINSITINSSLPDTLIIYVGSAKQLFNTIIDNTNYIITSNGSVVPEKPNAALKNLAIVFRKSPSGIIDYKQIIKPKDLSTIDKIIQQLEKNIIDIEITNIQYLPIERETHIKTQSETILIFDINENIDDQIEKVVIFHNEQLPITQNTIHYIDLRIGKKIFYCSNETKTSCSNNLRNIYGTPNQ